MSKSYFLGLVLLLLFNTGKGYAQSPFLYEHPNKAPDAISPLFSLLSSLNNTILGSYGISGTDQRWDTVQQHYRGNILSYLYYPEMAAAGYSSFSVAKTSVFNPWANLSNSTAFFAKLDEIQKNLNEDNGRRKIRYYYDRSGWLRAVEEVSINPQYQGFYEQCDRLRETKNIGGFITILRMIIFYLKSMMQLKI